MLRNQVLIYIIIFIAFNSHAQDNINTLNAEQVLALVRQFHPIVRQMNIEIEKSKADITIARGAFNPVLSYYAAGKTFNGTNYYNDFSPEIKIPTWYGIELSGGLENLSGNRLDPSLTAGKTSYLGVSVSLVKNLVIDKRRAFLQQAKIFNTLAEVEKRVVVNDLLMNAAEVYWNWVKAYQTFVVVRNNVQINQKRVEFIKKSFINGERAAIDTVEAVAQLQSFQFQQNQYWVEFQNAGLQLSAYLWKNTNEPYILPETIVPQEGWENEINILNFNLILPDLLTLADNNHPDLQFYNFKLDAMNIDKKLKFQELLPKVDFRYNQLSKGYNLLETSSAGPLFQNNFQYGLKIEVPLLFSQGRGEYKKAQLKIEETILDQNQKKLQIALKIKNYYNEFLNLKNQIALQNNNYNNYLALVRAEETKFLNGESSLFLINSRENKALDALEKLVALKTKYYKTIYSLQWSAGLLQ